MARIPGRRIPGIPAWFITNTNNNTNTNTNTSINININDDYLLDSYDPQPPVYVPSSPSYMHAYMDTSDSESDSSETEEDPWIAKQNRRDDAFAFQGYGSRLFLRFAILTITLRP